MGKGIMELDLPSANCTEFSLSGEFSVPAEVHDRIVSLTGETESRSVQDLKAEVARYGSKYEVSDTTIGMVGGLMWVVHPDGPLYSISMTYFWVTDSLPPPPDDFKPIENLLEAVGILPMEIAIDCEATFVYQLGPTIQSRVVLPTPLLLADHGSTDPLTDIESVTLSRREDGAPTHKVLVELVNDGAAISHIIEFTTSTSLTLDSINQIYELAGRLSSSLITRRMEV